LTPLLPVPLMVARTACSGGLKVGRKTSACAGRIGANCPSGLIFWPDIYPLAAGLSRKRPGRAQARFAGSRKYFSPDK